MPIALSGVPENIFKKRAITYAFCVALVPRFTLVCKVNLLIGIIYSYRSIAIGELHGRKSLKTWICAENILVASAGIFGGGIVLKTDESCIRSEQLLPDSACLPLSKLLTVKYMQFWYFYYSYFSNL